MATLTSDVQHQNKNTAVFSPSQVASQRESATLSALSFPLPMDIAKQFQASADGQVLHINYAIEQQGQYFNKNESTRSLEPPNSVVSQERKSPHHDKTINRQHSPVSDAPVRDKIDVKIKFICDLEAKLKQEYKSINYPFITDSVANQFCELLLVDLNSMLPVTTFDIAKKLSSSKIVYLTGENGSGKRMILHHLTKEWAENRMLQEFKLVFLIFNDKLPAHFEMISKFLGDSLILLLVYCVSYENPISRHFARVQPKFFPKVQSFPNVKILFAFEACPSVNFAFEDCPFSSSRSISHEFQVIGFTQSGLKGFVDSCFSDSPDDLQRWNTWIYDHAFASALIFRPLYCAMLVHLHKNGMLGDSIVNFTSLYKEFIVSFIRQHTKSPIYFLSDLKDSDLEKYKTFIDFCHRYVNHPTLNSVEPNGEHYGLVIKEANFHCFRHRSLPLLLAAIKAKDESDGSTSFNFLINLFLISLNLKDRSLSGSSSYSLYQVFETQQSLSSKFNDHNCRSPGYRIFDPLYWYVYGFCVNHIPTQELHIPPNMPAEYRWLAIRMIHQSLKHPKLRDCNNMTKTITGNREMWNYIEAVETKQCDFVTKLCISEITEPFFEDHHFSDLFPCLLFLKISCNQWSPFFNSLSELNCLETLSICNPLVFANSLPSNIPSLVQHSLTLRHLFLEKTSADFLEAMFGMLASQKTVILETLTICSSHISHFCLDYLLKMLSQSQLLMDVVFNGQCSFDSTNFASFIEHFLQSELKAVSLPGVIQDSLALKLSTVIKNNLPVSSDKILTITDSSLSGSALAPLVSAIANQNTTEKHSPKVSLRIPIEYKYDFHGSRNVSFYGNALLVDNPFIKFLS